MSNSQWLHTRNLHVQETEKRVIILNGEEILYWCQNKDMTPNSFTHSSNKHSKLGTRCISGMRLKMNKCPDPAKLPALEIMSWTSFEKTEIYHHCVSEDTAQINIWWNCSFQCFEPEEEHKWVPYVNDIISFKIIILWRESLSPLHITFYIIIKTLCDRRWGRGWCSMTRACRVSHLSRMQLWKEAFQRLW